MKIAFSNDHAALEQRDAIVRRLEQLGHTVLDFGARDGQSVDYPDKAAPVLDAVTSGEADFGVLMCGSGIGMSMVANRVRGIRCAMVTDLYGAEMSRRHNNANCLALRAREQDPATNERILDTFLATPYEGGRHERRVEKIDAVGCQIANSSNPAKVTP